MTTTLSRFIRGIAQGNRPTDEDCIFAAYEAGFDVELAINLRDCQHGYPIGSPC